MQITIIDMLDLISVGTPTSWGDVQKYTGEASKTIRSLYGDLDEVMGALQAANAEIAVLKAQNEYLRGVCEREHIASAVAALEAAE
ncbi:hypothetical protein ACT6QG_05370 [Xanthobacter sp. TB0136]|uniref:hypothetical protein n=1 Tax=Xanthobacter sp. TB0136 TaxID=3459177 RepID=UPI004039B89F